ncbi:hypothetical protein W97_05833 [Coniosporium apollinis CBS 100218]|uniref:Derlin n=1 Tax=Coniosporium apollinis (strain CBS 100218) TaxID=1168221 RepID=R7YXI6_CONA1|nr:uncharacterized protein W97_05833 [Coniosporium apollinis CBS 100218]EON66587.1 hypothetical protein W97_05833 [Coniosporium apollinis CBS 100218]
MDVFWNAPPVSRTYAAAAFVVSVLGYTGFIPLMPLVFVKPLVFKLPPQIWRVATAFLITGDKFGIIFDPYMLYTYGSQLEVGSSRFSRPGDFFTYLVFLCTVIAATAGFYLDAWRFIDAVTLAFAYTFAQDNPRKKVSIFILTFEARWLPYALLTFTFVMAGPYQAMIQATGLLAAHLYDFLTRIWPEFGGGRNVVVTPRFVGRWFGADTAGRPITRGYGTAFTPQTAETRPHEAGWSSGWEIPGTSWGNRGPGRRLGGE